MSQTNCECGCCSEGPLTQVPIKTLTFPCGGLTVGMDLSGIGNCQCNQMPPVDLYVATDGNDANDGLSPEAPFATIQAAVDSTRRFMRGDAPVTIWIAPGVYAGDVNIDFCNAVYRKLIFQPADASKPEINGSVYVDNNGFVTFDNIAIRSETIRAVYGSHITIKDCAITAAGDVERRYIFDAQYSATIYLLGAVAISFHDGARYVFSARTCGIMVIGAACTLNGTVSQYVATSWLNSTMYFTSTASLSGTVTGKRYMVTRCSIIDVNGRGVNFIPGTAAGGTGSGGQYA